MSRHAPIADRLLRLALRLYPAGLRRVHGEEMLELARRRRRRELRRGGPAARLRFWISLVHDLLRTRSTIRAPLPAFLRDAGADVGGPGYPHLSGAAPPPYEPRRRPRGAEALMSLLADVRLALRNARKEPAFTLAVVAVLALGIGANTAIFSALDAALLQPPPYPDPGRIVLAHLELVDPESGIADEVTVWSYPKFEVLRDGTELLDPVAGYTSAHMTLSGPGAPLRVPVEVVSPSYFEILAVDAERGRVFADGEEPGVLLSWGAWEARFGGDPDIVGEVVRIEGHPLTVVGVMPSGFRGLTGEADLWVPMSAMPVLHHPRRLEMRFAHWLSAVGRLQPGISPKAAEEELARVGEALDEGYRWEGQTHDQRVALEPLTEARVNSTARRSLLVLAGAVGLVLLIACANVAGLQLARSGSREHEAAIRAALGAGRSRLLLHYLTESLVLAVLGGVAGLLVALAGVRYLAASWPASLTHGGNGLRYLDPASVDLDPGVLAFTAVVSLLTGLAFGIVPALRVSGTDVVERLKDAGGRALGAASDARGRALLTAGQVALATLLLVAAGLLLGSLSRLHRVDPGMRTEDLLTFRYQLPRSAPGAEDPGAFHARFLERVGAIPGVLGATAGCLPVTGRPCDIVAVTEIVGRPDFTARDRFQAIRVQYVPAGHFETLGIRLLDGRPVEARDDEGAPLVAWLDETAARTYFPGEDPLGREMAIGTEPFGEHETARIVGVVDDVLYGEPDEEPMPTAYLSLRQAALPYTGVMVRTEGDPTAVVDTIRGVAAEMAPDMAIWDVATLQERLDAAFADTRLLFRLLAFYAATALLLAAVGIYGVVAYRVSRRRRELGLRMALGARASGIVRSVVGEGLVTVGAGIAAGLIGAAALGRTLSSLLYGVEATDPATFVAVAGILLVVALLAAWLPARRAARIDPMESLRTE